MNTILKRIILIVLLALNTSVYPDECQHCNANNELDLAPMDAFAIGTDININSVKELPTEPFNAILLEAQENNETWTTDFIDIAQRLPNLQFSGVEQSISVDISPGGIDWPEMRDELQWARITIVNAGWADDSVAGERTVMWVVPRDDGKLRVHRILWAEHCMRQYRQSYSSKGDCL
jgi:hypothetical protein